MHLLETGKLQFPIDICADARAVHDAMESSDCCERAESSLKLHLISVGGRLAQAILRSLYWTDTRDMLADGLTMGGADRALLNAVSEHNRYECRKLALRHAKKGALTPLKECPLPKFNEVIRELASYINCCRAPTPDSIV